MEKQYRELFDGVRASQRLRTEVLNMNKLERNEKRRGLGARHVLALAAVIALLSVVTVVAVAQVEADPTLGNFFKGDDEGYGQSSGVVGRQVEHNGWKATVTDCVGDKYRAYIGIEVEAPEGTVLDEGLYAMWVDNDFDTGGREERPYSYGGFAYSFEDDDPTDNKVRLRYDWASSDGGANHVKLRLKLSDFHKNHGYLYEERNWDRETLCEGEWDFGWMDIDYTDSTIHLEPNVEIPGGDGLVLTAADVSPLGIRLYYEGHIWYVDWVDNWFVPNVAGTVRVLDVDGNDLLENREIESFAGYYSFTPRYDESREMARLNIVDLDRIGSIVVAGVEIPVQQ